MEIRFDDVTYKNKYKDMDFSICSKYIYGIFLEDSITFEKLLTKELSIETLADVINKLGDLNGHQTKPIKICTENLVKLSEEQIAKIINKNWTIIQGW